MPMLLKSDTVPADLMTQLLALRRKVVTIGVESESADLKLKFHSHKRAQLMLSVCGVGICEAEGGVWLVPPQAALFVPAGVRHRVAVSGRIEGYAVFIDPQKANHLPLRCTTVTVNPLLRELIIRSAHFPKSVKARAAESRVTAFLLDELAMAPTGGLHLPMPTDPRLRLIFQRMMKEPGERGTIGVWAKRAGLSERTLLRLISAETGMSFGRWRQQLHLVLALQWMAEGATVQHIAFHLGYESAGSFITMFRKALGTSPARYAAEHFGKR